MSQPNAGDVWLSPTRAWRLIKCPASVRPIMGGVPATSTNQEVNTGTLAHLVLEWWIHAEGYRAADPNAALEMAADACVAKLSHGQPPGWRVSRARLVARATSLVHLIGDRKPAQVLPEIELTDEELKLRGQLDLLLLGDEIVVVDLKTQTLSEEELPEWVAFQLAVYAHLVRKSYGRLPTRSEVFSLNRGRIDLSLTEESIRSALDRLAEARSVDTSLAYPSPETCSFCARRLICEPHWDAAPTWSDTDVVRGVLVRVEMAASGVAAMLLDTSKGPAWASGIPANLVNGIPGQQVRLVRMHGRRATAHDVPEWRWTRVSAIGFF